MSFVITQGCCNDGACIPVCPVQCIRPRPGDPDFSHTEQLYIDPATCIDCGACMDACPVDAIHPDWEMPEKMVDFLDINAEYFDLHPLGDVSVPSFIRRVLPEGHSTLRVAVVGSGPAGCYAVGALSEIAKVTVSLFERLPTPYGLVRAGVAPDHPNTQKITERFGKVLQRPNVHCFFNVEVGKDVSLQELLEHHHAVIWAGGARSDRVMDVPGEELPGCYSARDFVAWYNGHPDQADRTFVLDPDRVVVIGNGNVALDVARTLLLPQDVLRTTDMSDVAIEAITAANVREVVVVARRGSEHAAYSLGELMALEKVEGLTLAVDPGDIDEALQNDRRQDVLRRAASTTVDDTAGKRIIRLRYGLQPVSVNGVDQVESITFRGADGRLETILTSTALRAIGYRGLPVDGLPFDAVTATLPNDAGRVMSPETDLEIPGVYCTGWIKRGSRGIIGTNKVDAGETVDSILRDLTADCLTQPTSDLEQLMTLLEQRKVDVVDKSAWRRIDRTEKAKGSAESRPRKKLLSIQALMVAAREEA